MLKGRRIPNSWLGALAIGNLCLLYVRGQGVKENHAKHNITATRGLTTEVVVAAQALSEELRSAKELLCRAVSL